ncbi:MAG TPA: Spy/CpxP family protein refolding chaperone [Pseudolabrys sp.]|nr:Spy/CpxP family protein refolding chaperone [Pseudolabrys sp.]
MKSFLMSAAVIAVAGTILAVPAIAQPAGPDPGNPPVAGTPAPGGGPGAGSGSGPGYGPRGFGWGPGMMMGPGMMGWSGGRGGLGAMCDPRAAGLAEWRMERVERLITPTDAQRSALNDLRTASSKAADIVAAACPREFPANASMRLELLEKRLDAMQQAIKIVRPAFDAFYATLDDEQKVRINTSGPRRWGWRGWSRGG